MNKLSIDCQSVTVIIPEKHDPALPIPLSLKLDLDDPNCFATADGRRVYTSKEHAETFMKIASKAYQDEAYARAAASRLVKSVVVEDWDSYVTCTGDEDDYSESVGDLIERYAENSADQPAWCFCTTETVFNFDLEDIIYNYVSENHHEDATDLISDMPSLMTFWKEWAAKQNITTYFMDTSRIVVINQERYEAELNAAKAFLAGEAP